ncbi:MAG: hypothetical protein ACRDVE_14960 [Actinocrinis sp.]
MTRTVTAAAGLETGLGGGPADCGGASIAFLKNGHSLKNGNSLEAGSDLKTAMTVPESSSYVWTFRLGAPARCGLSLYIADNEASSGFAHYLLTIPAAIPTTGAAPGTVFQVNQSTSRGQWVSPLELGDLALYDGSVRLTLTDAGSYEHDTFHVTASAVRAVCTPMK